MTDTPKKYMSDMATMYLLKEKQKLIFPSMSCDDSWLMWFFIPVFAILSPLPGEKGDLYTNGFVPSIVPKKLGIPQAETVCTTIWSYRTYMQISPKP